MMRMLMTDEEVNHVCSRQMTPGGYLITRYQVRSYWPQGHSYGLSTDIQIRGHFLIQLVQSSFVYKPNKKLFPPLNTGRQTCNEIQREEMPLHTDIIG